jgi:hypothetical protein
MNEVCRMKALPGLSNQKCDEEASSWQWVVYMSLSSGDGAYDGTIDICLLQVGNAFLVIVDAVA